MTSLLLLNVIMILICYSMVFSSNDVPPLSHFFTFIRFIISEYMFVSIITVANVISLGYGGTYFVISLYGVCINGTFNEINNYIRYDYLCEPKECKYVNPFGLGSVFANIHEFLFGGRDWNTYSITRIIEKDSKV